MKKLLAAIALRKEAEARRDNISAPFKAQLKAALGELPALLAQAKEVEAEERQREEAAYQQAYDERHKLLLSGLECPPIPLPDGVTIAWVDAVEWDREELVDDLWDARRTSDDSVNLLTTLLEQGVLEINESKAKKFLKDNNAVPGLRLTKRPQIRVTLKKGS